MLYGRKMFVLFHIFMSHQNELMPSNPYDLHVEYIHYELQGLCCNCNVFKKHDVLRYDTTGHGKELIALSV